MAKLIVSTEAQADVDEILTYLEHAAGPLVTLRYGERFLIAFRHLMDFPETGARRPQFGVDMRIWVIAPYVVFYRFAPADETIRVLRVLHGRRNITRQLFFR